MRAHRVYVPAPALNLSARPVQRPRESVRLIAVCSAAREPAMREPTLSGEHDLERVLDIARQFELPAAVCVNKWNLNPEMTARIESSAAARM